MELSPEPVQCHPVHTHPPAHRGTARWWTKKSATTVERSYSPRRFERNKPPRPSVQLKHKAPIFKHLHLLVQRDLQINIGIQVDEKCSVVLFMPPLGHRLQPQIGLVKHLVLPKNINNVHGVLPQKDNQIIPHNAKKILRFNTWCATFIPIKQAVARIYVNNG